MITSPSRVAARTSSFPITNLVQSSKVRRPPHSASRIFRKTIFLVFIYLVLTVGILGSPTKIAHASDQASAKSETLSSQLLGFLPDIGFPNVSRIQFFPYGKFGYRKVGWRAIIPVPYTFLFNESADLVGDYYTIKLKEVDLWVAEAGIEAQFIGGATVFARISSNILQGLLNTWFPETREAAERLLGKQSDFSWIEVETGFIKSILGPLSIEAGLRYDDFRLAFKEPYEIKAATGSKITSVTFKAYQADSYIWLPYIGCGLNGKSVKAFLSGSLFAPSHIKMEARVSANASQISGVSCYTILTSNEPASYLELNIQYLMNWLPLVNLSLWGKSGWLRISGKGDVTNNCVSSPGFSVLPLDEINLTFTRYDIAAGLSSEYQLLRACVTKSSTTAAKLKGSETIKTEL